MDRWLRGPREILDQAILHYRARTSKDDRFAMLQTDNAVELLARTYLLRRKTISEHDLTMVRFPDLIHMLQESVPHEIAADDVERILFLHAIRNLLYHETTVLTVRREDVEDYLSTAMLLLRRLFDVGMDFEIESIPDTRLLLRSENAIQYYRRILGEGASGLLQYVLFPLPLMILANDKRSQAADPVSIHKLSYVFPRTGIFLVRDLSLTLSRGEGLAIRGPNGVGKTTFLKLLTGELEQSAGSISMFGISEAKSRFLMTRPSWSFKIPESATIGEILDLQARQFKSDYSNHRALFGKLIEESFPELERVSTLNTEFSRLSGGEKQLAVLLGIASLRPSLLIVDEFGALAESNINKTCEALDRLRKDERTSLVLVSHRTLPFRDCREITFAGQGLVTLT